MANEYKDIELDMKDIDTDALHEEIKAQLGDKFFGLSTSGDKVILHVAPGATGAEMSKARRAFDEHDKASLPPKPVVKTDKERIAELEAAVAELLATKGNPK